MTAVAETGMPAAEITFDDLGLPNDLVRALRRRDVTTAFPIQAATIPDALAGRDVLGRGRTGSGKTLAFGLPTLARLEGRKARRCRPLALVLVPTRELAMQVRDALGPYAYILGLSTLSVFGGAPMYRQIEQLRRGVELLVATPGRLGDLINRGECSLDEVEITVLDEADQMADMGFLPVVKELLDQVRPGGQRLLFSATLDGAIDELVTGYLNDPVTHEVDPSAGAVTTMSHHLLVVEPRDKSAVAAEIAGRDGRTLFFVRTKLAVDRVAEQLRDQGLPVAGLHGGMTQRARTRTLAEFREGKVPVLVATDVAARGIHVDGIDLVLHVDPTNDPKDYLHRAGRTARAGEDGVVVTLVLPKQRKSVDRMLTSAGVEAEWSKVSPGSERLRDLTGARSTADARGARTSRASVGGTGDGGAASTKPHRPGRHDRHVRNERDVRVERHTTAAPASRPAKAPVKAPVKASAKNGARKSRPTATARPTWFA